MLICGGVCVADSLWVGSGAPSPPPLHPRRVPLTQTAGWTLAAPRTRSRCWATHRPGPEQVWRYHSHEIARWLIFSSTGGAWAVFYWRIPDSRPLSFAGVLLGNCVAFRGCSLNPHSCAGFWVGSAKREFCLVVTPDAIWAVKLYSFKDTNKRPISCRLLYIIIVAVIYYY